MELGKHVRLKRIFSHPSCNICSVVVDHFPIYHTGLPRRLRQIRKSLEAIRAGKPSAITLHKGMALYGNPVPEKSR